jgi:cysteine-S-conjugate beta-lyase
MKPETSILHPSSSLKDPYGATSTPIYQTATFAQPHADQSGEYDYSRSGNPTRDELQIQLASLDNAKHAFTFTTGMAAISAICRILEPGDEIIANLDVYGGTHRYFTQVLAKQNIKTHFVNTKNPEKIISYINKNTKLLWIETPSNPFQHITDIKEIASLKDQLGLQLCIDNSMMSSWAQKPLSLGADVVIQSATKYLSGHSDLSAGVVTTNSPYFANHLTFIQNAEGTALAPFDSWLLIRGLQTIALRFERQQENATKLTNYLVNNSLVKRVYYARLVGHEGYQTHRNQATGFGGVLSFETESKAFSKAIVEATKLFSISVSFGSLKSTISLPCYMSHASISDDDQTIPNNLIRISVGIENIDDLIADLRQGFHAAKNTLRIAKSSEV